MVKSFFDIEVPLGKYNSMSKMRNSVYIAVFDGFGDILVSLFFIDIFRGEGKNLMPGADFSALGYSATISNSSVFEFVQTNGFGLTTSQHPAPITSL